MNGDTTQEGITAAVSDADGILTGDIDLDGAEWTPIGDYADSTSPCYAGTFNGDGHIVEGLYISSSSSYQGLFGWVATNGTVQSVTVSGTVDGKTNIGGVVGMNCGTVINCCSSVSVSGYLCNVGGVVGENDGTMINCSNSGTVVQTEQATTGGVVGSNVGTVINCSNTGTVIGRGVVGGVAGYNAGSISNCYNSGAVSGDEMVGGIVGNNDADFTNNASVTNCYYLSTTASAAYGNNNGTITNVESKTSIQFASGEVAWLLTDGTTDGTQAWYQTLGTDSYPVLDSTHGTVYYTTAGCDGSTVTGTYSNSSVIHAGSNYDNGFCTNCGAYQPATLNGSTYEISNAGQLFWFAALVSGDTTQEGITAANTGASAVLTADITIPSGCEWTPIGTKSAPYTGTFDGAGYTVSGMSITTASDYVGLFGYVSAGTVKDLTVSGEINVSGNTMCVGGIVGTVKNGTLSGLTSYVNVTGYDSKKGIIGGVVAKAEGNNGTAGSTVERCANYGKVTAGGVLDCVGGIVGYMNAATIKDCANYGTVDTSGGEAAASDGIYTGGIVGYINNANANVINCFNVGTIFDVDSSSIVSYTGAIIGRINQNVGSVTNCYYLSSDNSTLVGVGGNGSSVTAETTEKTVAEFASGEVAWCLQNANTDYVWGQKITGSTTDAYPILISDESSQGDKKVVRVAFYKVPGGTVADTPFAYGYTNVGQLLSDYPDDAEYTFYMYQELTGQIDTDTTTFSVDTSVYVYMVPNIYTVKWVDEDGRLLKTDTDVEEGTTPGYSGTTPTKATDDTYIYTFSGWSPEVGAVTADTTYTAQYSKTYVAPAAGAGYTIDYSAETATAADGYEISTDGTTWSSGSLAVAPGGMLYVRRAVDTEANASAATENTLSSRPGAPDVTAVDEVWYGECDGQITDVTTAMEYSADGITWTSCSGTAVTGLVAGSYEVRFKATASTFTGEAATVTIASGTVRTYTLTVTAPTFAAVTYGYTQPDAVSITIESSGNSDATIVSVAVDKTSYFTIAGSGSTVTAGGSVTTWTIQPAAGLDAGTYSDTVTVTYNGGATATAEVSFTVNKAAQSISYSADPMSVHVNDAAFINKLTETTVVGAITYASTDETVAKVNANSGEVTIVGAGTALITATAAETDNYEEATAAYTLTVTDHRYTSAVTEPTCTTRGYTTHTCEICGDSYIDSETEATGHTHGEAVKENEAAAICTKDGSYESVVYCTECGAELSRETVTISATGHSYESVVTEPTCTTGGYTTHTCTVCGDSYIDSKTEALGHSWGDGVVTTEATCTTDGVKTYTCTACGETKTEAIAATGHKSGEAVKENEVAATCTEDGSYDSVVYCTECGEELSRETVTVPATGHSYESVVTEPTCTTGGYTTHTCTVCGDSYIDSETEALGHSWGDGVITTEATCTEDGVKTFTCTVCGETKTETISATGHSLAHVDAKEATCMEDGNMEYWYCETCGEYFSDAEGITEISQADTVISSTVHTSGEAVKENEAAATCTEAGSYDSVVYCTECGEELSRETVTVPATGHNYESVVTEPTCTEGGYTTHTCTVCGDSYVDSETKATGHSWDEGVVTTEATETADGVRTYTCTECGETYTEVIEASGSTETGNSEETDNIATETSADGETESTATETTATENTSDTDTSLRTGDDSKWLLWTVLLILSGAGVISIEAYGKRKRAVG